jgi:hypothetical protein
MLHALSMQSACCMQMAPWPLPCVTHTKTDWIKTSPQKITTLEYMIFLSVYVFERTFIARHETFEMQSNLEIHSSVGYLTQQTPPQLVAVVRKQQPSHSLDHGHNEQSVDPFLHST